MPGSDQAGERFPERTVRPDRKVHRVSALDEGPHQIGDVSLAATPLARRAYLKDSHSYSLRALTRLRGANLIELAVRRKQDTRR
jgi:hypothetical protein